MSGLLCRSNDDWQSGNRSDWLYRSGCCLLLSSPSLSSFRRTPNTLGITSRISLTEITHLDTEEEDSLPMASLTYLLHQQDQVEPWRIGSSAEGRVGDEEV